MLFNEGNRAHAAVIFNLMEQMKNLKKPVWFGQQTFESVYRMIKMCMDEVGLGRDSIKDCLVNSVASDVEEALEYVINAGHISSIDEHHFKMSPTNLT